MDQVVDRFIAREKGLVDLLKDRTPVVETYLQNVKADADLGLIPTGDKYFLGHMDLGEDIEHRTYLKDSASIQKHLLGGMNKLFTVQYKPLGFSWMIFADRDEFDREHYEFKFIRREFLGDVRALVFDVTPKKEAGNGRFRGAFCIPGGWRVIERFCTDPGPEERRWRPFAERGSAYLVHRWGQPRFTTDQRTRLLASPRWPIRKAVRARARRRPDAGEGRWV